MESSSPCGCIFCTKLFAPQIRVRARRMPESPLLSLNLEALLGVLQFLEVRDLVRLKRTNRTLYSFITAHSTALRHQPGALYVKIHNNESSSVEEYDAALMMEQLDTASIDSIPHIGVEIRRGHVDLTTDNISFLTETESGAKLRVSQLPPPTPEPPITDEERRRAGGRVIRARVYTAWEASPIRYRVEASKDVPQQELLRAVLRLFTKHLSFGSMTIWGEKDAAWSEAAMSIIAQLSTGLERYLKNAQVQYGKQKTPDERLIQEFIENAHIDHFKIYDHLPFRISDAFFRSPVVKAMAFFVFEGDATDISDEAFGQLEAFRLSLCKSKNVTVKGIRQYIQPVVDLEKEDKHVTIDLTWKDEDWNKLVEDLPHQAEYNANGQTWIVETADPKKKVNLSLKSERGEYQFWAKVEEKKEKSEEKPHHGQKH